MVVHENRVIETLAGALPRSTDQIGGLQESDAELFRIPGFDGVLAATTDAIVEEIQMGLYEDPYLIGWMTVAVNASDLAAVGAQPLGMLVNETLPPDITESTAEMIQRGIGDAARAAGLPILGGDTNTSAVMQMGGTALGLISEGEPMTRRGCRPGDLVFSSGRLGLGTVYAVARLGRDVFRQLPDFDFRPESRLELGGVVREFASACIDTSDGALAALDQLTRLNEVGFRLDTTEALHPAAAELAHTAGLPPWMMLAGLHGEFELLFTVPPERAGEMLDATDAIDKTDATCHPVLVGSVVSESQISADGCDGPVLLDTGAIRNLFANPIHDLTSCIAQLMTMEEPCTQ